MRTSLLALVALSLSLPASAVPLRYTQQGALTDASGAPLSGTHTLAFRLHDASAGGSAVWAEAQDVSFADGRYSVVLGAASPLDAAVLDTGSLWLELEVDGVVLAPRQELTSVPYATLSGTAARVSGEVDATVLRVGGREVVGTDGTWVGGVAWDALTGVPADLSDGDGDALAGLSCGDGDVAAWDAVLGGWTCAADADTLAGLGCLSGEVAAFDGVSWGCGADPVVALAALDSRVGACEGDLASLATQVGTLSGEVVTLRAGLASLDARVATTEGAAAVLGARVTSAEAGVGGLDTRLGGVEADVAGLASVAYTARFSDLVAVPAGLSDGDDDTLAGLGCIDGAIPVYTLATRSWGCGVDRDTTLTAAEVRAIVTATGIDLAAGTTIGGRSPRFVDEPDTLGALSCGDGEIVRWDGALGEWTCDVERMLSEAEVDAMVADNGYAAASSVTALGSRVTTAEGTLATVAGRVTTAEGTLSAHGGRLTSLEAATDADTLAGLSCTDGEVARWDGTLGEWTCATDRVLTDAEVVAAIASQIVAPSRVDVGDSRLSDGSLDLGTASDDALSAAMVRTLTGGGDADALHTHAGAASSGGACYTAWGTTSCGTGFSVMYSGIGLMGTLVASTPTWGSNGTSSAVGPMCVNSTTLSAAGGMGGITVNPGLTSLAQNLRYSTSAGDLTCAVCCK